MKFSFWCLITGHVPYWLNHYPRFVIENGMAIQQYDEPKYICFVCGKTLRNKSNTSVAKSNEGIK